MQRKRWSWVWRLASWPDFTYYVHQCNLPLSPHLYQCFAQIQVLQLLNYASLIIHSSVQIPPVTVTSTEPSPDFFTRPSDLSDQDVSLVAPNSDLIAGHIVLSQQSLSQVSHSYFKCDLLHETLFSQPLSLFLHLKPCFSCSSYSLHRKANCFSALSPKTAELISLCPGQTTSSQHQERRRIC